MQMLNSDTVSAAPTSMLSSIRPLRVLVTGGGTGGHTTPAVATIQALQENSSFSETPIAFAYLGSKTGVEGEIARGMDIPFYGIETGKLRRSRSLAGLFSRANLLDALRVPVGYVGAIRAVRRFQPDVVLSTGGYVSVPGVLAAAALRIPVVAHEQTVQVGLANKINFRVARKIAVSVDETLDALPQFQRRKAVVTGNPVREVIFHGSAQRALDHFNLEVGDLPTVYVTGGAQGSRLMNEAVHEALPTLLEHCRIIHQCGSQQDFDSLYEARAALPETLRRRYAVTRFVGAEIGDVYALADLIIGRSGAGTVTEACALGKPCLFVPLVPTGGDEQMRNARRMALAGAAVIVAQNELTAESLFAAARPLLSDPALLHQMGRTAYGLAKPGAAIKLAELVLQAAMMQKGKQQST